MPLPEGWNGIFYSKATGGDLIFDLSAEQFADYLLEHEPDQAACLMANAVFDLLWNQQNDRAAVFSTEGKRRWPDKPFGLEAFVAMVTQEMIRSGCDEKPARSGASNSMARLFGGMVFYTYNATDLIGSDAITFEFEGQRYKANKKACDFGFIRLPDGRLLRVDSWSNSTPPRPNAIVVVDVAKAVGDTG